MTAGRAGSLLAVVGVLLASVGVPLAGVTVSAGPALAADAPEFEPTIVDVRQGQTATVGITVPESANGSYRLEVGSKDEGFLARATVRDADADGSITVGVDTRTAGDGDPGAYLNVSEGDALRNATQVTSANEPDRPLAAGMYDLNLTDDGELVAVGTLTVSGSYEGETETETGTETTPTSESDGRETATVDATGTNFVYEGDAIRLLNTTGQVVRGETTLDAGTHVIVRLRSVKYNFLLTKRVAVSESGTFDATFDMRDAAPGALFEAQVIRNGTLASADGRVIGCSEDCNRTTTTGETGDATTTLPADELDVQSVVEVTRTKTASIPVTFGDAEALTVVVGGEAVNYVVTGTVRDDDGDGRAVVRFYTENAGFDAPTLSSDDELERKTESSLSSTLDAGNYPVEVYRGTNASGNPAVTGRVVVYEAGAPVPAETSDEPSTATETTVGTDDDRSAPSDADSEDRLLGGFGMLALGGVLAVAGIGVLLGLFRR